MKINVGLDKSIKAYSRVGSLVFRLGINWFFNFDYKRWKIYLGFFVIEIQNYDPDDLPLPFDNE